MAKAANFKKFVQKKKNSVIKGRIQARKERMEKRINRKKTSEEKNYESDCSRW
jgi:hypothetical protein